MKILVVEDEVEMLKMIKETLENNQYKVEEAVDFESAWQKIGVYNYDLVILDITLPKGNGLTILERLKELQKSEGVLIISAKDSLDDKLKGLNLGADDYLTKPFQMAELTARVNAILRRKKFEGSNTIEWKNLKVLPEERTAFVDHSQLNLNRKEFDILLYLLVNKNKLVTKTALAEQVWGDYIDAADSFEFIYSQIKNLRKKLRDNSAEVEVQATYGIGYKLQSI